MKRIDLQRHVPRFWSKVDVRDDHSCWEWRASTDSFGYGKFHPVHGGTAIRAHRLAYFLWYGEDPGDMCVCHHCDNPLCCNPQHYFLGTREDNNKDRSAKGRDFVPSGEDHPGAKLTWAAADDIRSSPLSAPMLAKRYGVSVYSIYNVRSGRTWPLSNAQARAMTSSNYEE